MKSADHDCCYLQVLVEMYILNVFVFLLQIEMCLFLIIIIFTMNSNASSDISIC